MKNKLNPKAGDYLKKTPFIWGRFVPDQCYQQQVRAYSTLTFTMNVKSVKAGEYTAPPAQGPIMREICGTTPEHRTFLCNREKKKRHLVWGEKSIFKSVARFCKNSHSQAGEGSWLYLLGDKRLVRMLANTTKIICVPVFLLSVPLHLVSYTT